LLRLLAGYVSRGGVERSVPLGEVARELMRA